MALALIVKLSVHFELIFVCGCDMSPLSFFCLYNPVVLGPCISSLNGFFIFVTKSFLATSLFMGLAFHVTQDGRILQVGGDDSVEHGECTQWTFLNGKFYVVFC